MKDKKWIDEPMRISAVQCKFGEDSDKIFSDFTLDFGFNVEQLNHLFKTGFQGEFLEEKHGEKLREYVKNAHDNGVKEIIYFCLHELFESDKKEHPEWLQHYRDGSEVSIYGSHFLGCPNSPWRDYSIKRAAQLATYDIDGIFLDGPVFYIDACYCPACKKRFRDEYGHELEDATHREFMQFRTDKLTEFVADIRKAVDAVKPGIMMYLNNSALRADITGSNTRRLHPYVDIIGAEGGFFVVNKIESLYLTSAMAKDIECKAEGKPTVIFFAGDSKPNSFYMHTAGETARVFAQSVSNGANVWYGLHGYARLKDSEGGKRAKQFLQYLKKYEEFYSASKPCARIGLMWSGDTANYYSSTVAEGDFTGDGTALNAAQFRGDHYQEFLGCYEMLAQNHAQFDVIDEKSLDKISDYELIVLPCCACMSVAAAKKIEDYVKKGGKVIASYETAIYDEFGDLHKVWPLEKLFGAKAGKNAKAFEGLGYQFVEGKDIPEILPAPVLYKNFTATSAVTESRRYATMEGRYEALTLSDTPAILSNKFGSGEVIAFTGNIGGYYYDWKDKNHLKLFGSYVKNLSDTVTETDAPKCVEITVRKQPEKGRYIIHLTNLAVSVNRPIDDLLPIYGFKVKLKIAGLKAAATVDGKALRCKVSSDGISIEVEKLTDYLAIVVS